MSMEKCARLFVTVFRTMMWRRFEQRYQRGSMNKQRASSVSIQLSSSSRSSNYSYRPEYANSPPRRRPISRSVPIRGRTRRDRGRRTSSRASTAPTGTARRVRACRRQSHREERLGSRRHGQLRALVAEQGRSEGASSPPRGCCLSTAGRIAEKTMPRRSAHERGERLDSRCDRCGSHPPGVDCIDLGECGRSV